MMLDRIASWIATVGPIGRIKFAPGTFGSLAAVPLLLLVGERQFVLCVVLLAVSFLAIWSSDRTAKLMRITDPSIVVIDEVCGMLTTFLFIQINPYSLAAGFVCFRFFDILKPPPIQLLERAHGGLGIVLDDIGAGLYANLILQIFFHHA